ncbi:hypothetical protein P3C35_11225 [Mesorhizobium sp. LMG15046]|nr:MULTISPECIES: hypothetical protein [unclassified Mesorhizobium]MDF3208367.1 hypothetical protein [Mesorhizobium sp. LMG15046]
MIVTFENRAAAESAIRLLPLEWLITIHPIPGTEKVRVFITPWESGK